MAVLDTLSIDVIANTGVATKNIKRLTANIRSLRDTFASLNSGKDSLKPLYEGLKDIATLDFSKSIDGLSQVASILKSLETKGIAKELNALGKTGGLQGGILPALESTEKDSGQVSPLATNEYKGMSRQDLISYYEQLQSSFAKIADENPFEDISKEADYFSQEMVKVQEALETAVDEVKELNIEITETTQEVNQAVMGFARLSLNEGQLSKLSSAIRAVESEIDPSQAVEIRQALLEEGYSLERTTQILERMGLVEREVSEENDNLSTSQEKLSSASSKSTSKLGKFFNSLKRIALYRAIRAVLKEITKSLKEGIEDVALFDSKFNTSMSELKSSAQYLKNAVGSIISPIVQMVQPALTKMIDTLAEVSNSFAEFFAVMNGQSTFTKAIKGAEDYAEGLKKAKNASIGIDELNVLSAEDDKQNFVEEQVNASEEVVNFAGKIKDFFGKVREFLSQIWSKIKPVVQDLMPQLEKILDKIFGLVEALMPIIDLIISLVSDFIMITDDSVNSLVENLIGALTSVVKLVANVLDLLKPILDLINIITAIANSFGNTILGKILLALSKVVDFLDRIITKAKEAMGGGLLELFYGERGAKIIRQVKTEYVNGAFATGGFPEDGLFYANHNELVGKFTNGKTAVANNEQIVEGIKRGVIEAMQQSGGGSANVVVYLDSREIASRVEENIDNRGVKTFSGGYSNGR